MYTYPPSGFYQPFLSRPISLPARCTVPGGIHHCEPEQPVIQHIPMVRFHATDDYSLVNKNTGDARGDTSFICSTLASGVHSSNQIISVYEVCKPNRIEWRVLMLCAGRSEHNVGPIRILQRRSVQGR